MFTSLLLFVNLEIETVSRTENLASIIGVPGFVGGGGGGGGASSWTQYPDMAPGHC